MYCTLQIKNKQVIRLMLKKSDLVKEKNIVKHNGFICQKTFLFLKP